MKVTKVTKELKIASRRNEFFLKFFSDNAKKEFNEEVCKANAQGFMNFMVIEKYVPGSKERYFEISKINHEESTLEHLVRKCQIDCSFQSESQEEADAIWEKLLTKAQQIPDACFAWKAYDCMYAEVPNSVVVVA